MSGWRAGPEKPKTRYYWECSRQLHGRVHARILGPDGHEHDVHKDCAARMGARVVSQSTTVTR